HRFRIEGLAGRVRAERVVDAEVEGGVAERLRSPAGTFAIERTCVEVERLREEQAGLEGDDLLALRVGEGVRLLRVPLGRAVRLVGQVLRASTVETSAGGEVEPSLGRKIGSRPRVRSKRWRSAAGVTVQPWLATWQLTQARPLLPRLRKKRLCVSIDPLGVTVRATPL